MPLSARAMEHVVVEAVFFVPQFNAFSTSVIHSVRYVDEVLEELAGDTFIGWILPREFQRNGQHVQAIHAHPTGSVRLLEMPTGRKGRGAIEDPNIVKPQE